MLNEIQDFLYRHPHLAEGLEKLSRDEQEKFLCQLKKFSRDLLEEQRLVTPPSLGPITPVSEFERPGKTAILKGEELLAKGKAACLVLAGGMGSRLGAGPKALFQIGQKTLLQLICEKTKAASRTYKKPLPLAVMTSPLNHSLIAAYLEAHDYFGLSPDQLHLFVQETVPFLNEEKNWFLEAPGIVAEGPDGNGHALRNLAQAGIVNRWKKQGIELVNTVPIENPLADPFDPALCGSLAQNDVVIKAIERRDAAEKVGVLVERDGRICVQEYSELPSSCDAPLAHIGLFCFALSFVEKAASCVLPWHLARKKHQEQMIWKFERFLFDVLPHASRCKVLVYPREKVYAPLKSLDNLAAVQQAMIDQL